MAHDFHGSAPSRHGRKLSKLGPGIIDARRLEELLHPMCPDCESEDGCLVHDENEGRTDSDGADHDEGGEG